MSVSLPSGHSDAQRNTLLQEFERGRAHLLYTFTLKVSCYTQPPLLLFGCAHYSHASSLGALNTCINSNLTHPQIVQLQTEPLASQVQEYVDGTALGELPDLEMFIASLRFTFAVERRIEGGHAIIQRHARGTSIRSESFDSLALRMPEVQLAMQSSPAFVRQLTASLEAARSPKQLVHKLGLSLHPSCAFAKSSWDKIYRKLVYRADLHTMYRSRKPKLQVGAPPPPPAPPQPPLPPHPDEAPPHDLQAADTPQALPKLPPPDHPVAGDMQLVADFLELACDTAIPIVADTVHVESQ